jgi:peptide deformylase
VNDKVVVDQARLREPSASVAFDAKTRFLARRLTLAATNGRRVIGIAAPQIGARQRMFHYDLSTYGGRGGLPSRGIVCNPTVLEASDETWDREEGCLSFPRQFIVVRRPRTVHFEWFDIRGERFETTLTGMPGRVWQHESDHLDGILMVDRAVDGAELVRL